MAMAAKGKLLVVSVAGLGYELLESRRALDRGPCAFRSATTVFPAVTCTAQATFRTAAPPDVHGMIANGLYDRHGRKASFWEQASSLVEGERIWSAFRAAGRTVGLLFWQQAMGEAADFVLTPAPIHKHHGGMVLDCYSQPAELYPRLRRSLGEFPLHRYWGPLASARVGDWIAAATADVLRQEAPGLLLTYLPTLDYDLQRFGPDDRRVDEALGMLLAQLARVLRAATDGGYDWLVIGDYAIGPCEGPAVLPNLCLLEAGLLEVRDVRGKLYPDLHRSRAFAVCDHEVAQVYVREAADVEAAVRCLAGLNGIAEVARASAAAHANSGELILTATPGRWLAYPWWEYSCQAPDYARHIDIHSKPGFDPCELFGTWLPPGISLDTSRVRGTHGRAERPIAWSGSLPFDPAPTSLQELAAGVRSWLNQTAAGGVSSVSG